MVPLQLVPVQGGLVGPEQLWLGVGAALMFLGTVYFWVRGWGVEDEEAKLFYAITTLVPAIAFASYLSMFLGFGVTGVGVLGETRPIYWARYADWLFTTPLLLLDLALLADADRSTVLALIGADGFMIVTGLVGALTTVFAYRFVWWAVSDVALIYILYTLYFGFTERARDQPDARASTFRVLRNLTLVLWTLYPVWWVLGTEGAGLLSLFVETAGFMVLDVTAKVGFGLILLRSRAALTGAAATPGDTGAGSATFEVYEDAAGEFRWRLRTPNGRIVGDSGEGYASRDGARRAVDRLREGFDEMEFEIYEDAAGEFRWRLRAANNRTMADSGEGYASRGNAGRAVKRVRQLLPDATVEEA